MRLYAYSNYRTIAYSLDHGAASRQVLQAIEEPVDLDYISIAYAINEYYLAWNKELDAREAGWDAEKEEWAKVSTPSQQTVRPLPRPVLICCSNRAVVETLWGGMVFPHYAEFVKRIRQVTTNVAVDYLYIPKRLNEARRIL